MCKKHGPTGRAARISGRSGPGQRHFIEIRAGPGRLQLSAGRSGPGHADILKSGPGRATSPLRPGRGPDWPVSLLSLNMKLMTENSTLCPFCLKIEAVHHTTDEGKHASS